MSETGDGHAEVRTAEGQLPGRTIFGHPIGLINLFGVELWERFSFYGMLTILGYYLYYTLDQGGLGLPQATATGIVGAYGGFVYFSTVLGGWLADRVLGMERTVFYGGVVVVLGHLALAVLPGLTGVGVGLVLVALGAGALKANASSLLGTLYAKGDVRADGGFTLFYLGINLGAFVGPIVTGLLQTSLGFHVGFGAAAVGMALGLIQYVVFRKNLGTAGRHPTNPLPRSGYPVAAAVIAAVVVVIAVVLLTGLVPLASVSTAVTVVLVLASIGYFAVLLRSPHVTAPERSRVRAFIPLFVANAAFWALFQQIFTTLAVYSDERMDWNVFGWTAPSNFIGSEEPIWIIVLSGVFAAMWTRLGDRAPSTPRKFAYGVIGMGVAFLLFLLFAGGTGKSTPAIAVLVILGFFAVSELLISPIGLAVTTKLAPEAFRAQMMALYFFSVGIGTSLSGRLAGFYSPDHEAAYFGINGAVVIVIGLVMYAIAPWISRQMEGVH
jgi:POT family proton-dependent oligopeptide transporter